MYSPAIYREAIEAGMCGNCHIRPRRTDRVTCEACYNSTRISHQIAYEMLKRRHICTQCKENGAIAHETKCAVCKEHSRLRSMASRRDPERNARMKQARRDRKDAKNMV